MHELAVTQSLIQSVLTECKKNNIKDIKKIIVELGSLTSYVDESIQFYFNLLKKDIQIIKNSSLEIHVEQGKIKCKDCKKTSTVQDPYLILCQHCQSTNIEIISGKEFIIKEIEIPGDEAHV